ncbi:MAG: aspartyl/asparaginyl beta-hydroxylase domain-containing protein [Methylobacter sp.]|nr:aspartyl/asparaginyl beta-hydroxylase domain-containing protein [Methylobacter sp.]
MKQATRHLRLPFEFDLAALQADLQSLLPDQWVPHYNAQAGDGYWHCQALRSSQGRGDDILAFSNNQFLDTPLLARCPYFQQVLQRFKCETCSVRLMALAPGGVISEHTDAGTNFEDGVARLHIPIITDPDVLFWLDDEPVHFAVGGTWYMNANCRHRVENRSAVHRIHLVLDCIPNQWLADIFNAAGFIANPEPKYGDPSITDANVLEIIAELRHRGTAAALHLAGRLAAVRHGQ